MKRTLSALLALLTALLLIRPAAAAARTVPVTVDDALLRETCYLESGSTLVPLRGLLGLLGGWTVSWQSGQAVAVSGSRAIRARPGASSFTVNGVSYPGAVSLRNGRTYLPLRPLCEALGLSVQWDGDLGGAAVRSGRAWSWAARTTASLVSPTPSGSLL